MGQLLVWEENGAAILICRKDSVGRGFLLLAENTIGKLYINNKYFIRDRGGGPMPSSYSLDDLKKRLQDSSYKLTHQRKVVLEVFVDNPGCHLSAEEVHDILKQKSADIGLATVYRSLELLSAKDIDILQKIEFGDGCSRYELNVTEPNTHQHHHLICTKCKKVMEFSEDMLDTLEADIMEKCGFKVTDHQVKFFGLCEECRKKLAD